MLLAITFLLLGVLNMTFYTTFAASARRLLSTRRAQRGFNVAGGALLSAAGVYALMARRSTQLMGITSRVNTVRD